MLYYNKIDIFKGIDVAKSNKSKECMICHYWHFLDKGFRFELLVYNSCHDVLMMAFGLENIAILNFKGADYRCITWNLSRSDAINR